MVRAPIIYSGPRATGVPFRSLDQWTQGLLGHITALTIHHSAGPRATSKARAMMLNSQYDTMHLREGWGGIGYHFTIDDQGRVYCCRPLTAKGAHTGGHNTGNVGVCFHGNYETDSLTRRQRDTLKWLCSGGFNYLTGASEKNCILRGHREWSGPTNQTACPGKNLYRHLRWRRLVSWR